MYVSEILLFDCLLLAGTGWAVGGGAVVNRKSERQVQKSRMVGPLPPYRPWQLAAHPGALGRPALMAAWLAGPSHPLSPASSQCAGGAYTCVVYYSREGLWTNLAYWRSSDRKIAETETWKEQTATHAQQRTDSSSPPIHQSSLQQYTHAPFGPSTAATITQQVWPGLACPALPCPGWSFLVFCPLPLVNRPSSCHHITSPRIAHRISRRHSPHRISTLSSAH